MAKTARIHPRNIGPRLPTPLRVRVSAPRRLSKLKLPPGPKHLVKTKQLNIQTAAIEQANSTNSPLLRLPSEIRNRIYHYTFHVGVVHIGSLEANPPRTLPVTVCVAQKDQSETAKALRGSNAGDTRDGFTNRHRNCIAAQGCDEFAKRLDVLKVCRQIHREAALLPYQVNTFYIYLKYAKDFNNFRNALAPDQRKAVQSLGFYMDSSIERKPVPLRLRDMRSVRDLSLSLHLNVLDFRDARQPWLLNDDQDQNSKRLGMSMFDCFKEADLDLQTASVTIDPLFRGFLTPALAGVNRWAARVEKKLLAVDEDKIERTKKRTRSGKGFAGAGTKKQKIG